MESQLVSEFILRTGANQNDAISCLKTWSWDLKRAIIDYNDTCKTKLDNDVPDDDNSQLLVEIIPKSLSNNITRRPNLTKADSIDIVDSDRKLSRGISRATDNVNLVSRARTEIAMDYHQNCQKNLEQLHSIDTPDFTFILPNLYNYSDAFRTFLEKDLIETSTLNALELTRRLNWWVESGACRRLWPLATTGDGNCLLHAASLGMWGFHDRKLTLRKALHSILTSGKCRDSLFRRWRFQQTRFNKKAGFVYSEVEWAKEWFEIVSMASPEPRNHGTGPKEPNRRRMSATVGSDRNSFISVDSIDDTATYESLEEIHILALAHILRRTIIVISDTVLRDLNGEAMAPIPFGGIYLPFEIDAIECNRGPLLLAYDMAHFSALVGMESDSDYPPPLIPLTDNENVLLPIQFCIDPGEDFDWKTYDGSEGNWILTEREHVALLQEYLNIVYANNTGSPDEDFYEELSEEEFEKKFAESEVTIPPSTALGSNANSIVNLDETQGNNKSKAAKQLQSVAKQFGSIGKSMSKKIKKNIGSITKMGSANNKNSQKKLNLSSANSTQSFTCTRILCARLRVRRHEFQEEMIRNYLECAQNRFMEAEKLKEYRDAEKQNMELLTIKENVSLDDHIYCINAGCNRFASSNTSYLCPQCFEKQKYRENSSMSYMSNGPRYGTGKSKFYTQADVNSHDSIRQLPPVRRLNELDQTLYLSNSTFYNDNLPKYNEIGVPVQPNFYGHGYSPTTVRLSDKYSDPSDLPTGTASIFSPGNTLNKRQTVALPPLSSPTTAKPPHSAILSIETAPHSPDFLNLISPPISGNNKQLIDSTSRPLGTTMSSSSPSSSSSSSSAAMSPNPNSNANVVATNVVNSQIMGGVAMPLAQLQAKPCKTLGCMFYGSPSTNFFCSKCCQAISDSNNKINNTTATLINAKQANIIYPTATAQIAKTNSKIMSDI